MTASSKDERSLIEKLARLDTAPEYTDCIKVQEHLSKCPLCSAEVQWNTGDLV